VEHRVADRRILRLIQKWLKAGVSEDGQWSESKVGTPLWAVRRPRSGEAWRRKAGDLYVSGLHASLREAPEEWDIHRLAENGEEAHGGKAARY
jgi:hypothetical protein